MPSKSSFVPIADISSPRRLQSFQERDEIAVRETEIDTLVVIRR